MTLDTPPERLAFPMLVVVSFVLSLLLWAGHIQWPLDDFSEYWAAGRLNAAGKNPYDPAAVLQEQRAIGWQDPEPVMMYNPPWTLAFAMPVSAIEFQLARWIWLPVEILITLWCGRRLWLLYGGERHLAAYGYYLALLWSPTVIALRMGQLSPLILLGLVGFVWSLTCRRDVAAGALFSLTAVKPQLVALVWVPFLPWAILHRRWRVLAGTTICIGGGTLAAVATNPSVFLQFHHLMAAAPPTLAFESPNIATVLRYEMGTMGSWPQFLPTCFGAVVVGAIWYRKRAEWDWTRELPWVVLLSCLLTPYGGWSFDLIILLVPIVATAALVASGRSSSRIALATAAFLTVSLVAFVMHTARTPQFAFCWMTPVVATFSYSLSRRECTATDRGLGLQSCG